MGAFPGVSDSPADSSPVPILQVIDYHKMYLDTVAVSGLSFEIRAGEILGLLGPNGAGKTTTMRAIESSFTAEKLLKPSEGWTNTFIHPPYQFNIADALVTNFHLPKTSLLIMVCAFAGYDLAMEAYKKAIKDKYRFFSYGDAMIVI